MATPKLKLGNDKWATKSKSLLAYNDEGNNFKSLPFQVERLSGASYKGRNGLVQYAATEEPRIDFTNYSKGALLLEPTRRNLFLYSEDFTNSSWIKTRTTITGNQTTAPNGTEGADLLTGDGTGTSYVYDGVFLYNADYYISIFVKNINGNDFTIQNFTQGGTVVFDLVNKSVTSTSGTMSDAKIKEYPNNWFRVSAKITSTLGGANCNLGYGVKDYNGDQFYIWGAQVEDNASGGSVSYASSYIPTTDSTATRIVDLTENDSIPGDLINSTEGTLFIDFEYLYETTTDSSTDANRDFFILGTSADLSEGVSFDNYRSQFRVFIYQSSGNIFIGNSTAGQSQPNTRYKLAVKYKTGDCKAYLNGSLLGSSTGGVSFATDLNGIFFSYNSGTRPYKNQKRVYDLQYFDTALTDAELQTLTTL